MSTPSAFSSIYNLSLILGGCFINNVILEFMIKQDTGAGALITLFQFIFVALMMVLEQASWSGNFPVVRLSTRAPLLEYLKLTILFFVISVANNKAFEWGISQPFNVVFRSSSLLISFLVGLFIFKAKYSLLHFLGILFVTIGVTVTTGAEVLLKAKVMDPDGACCGDHPIVDRLTAVFFPPAGQAADSDLTTWMIGSFMLVSTLVGLAALGHMQSVVYRTYKSHPEEMMLWTHLMTMPMFLVIGSDLAEHWNKWQGSEVWEMFDGVTVRSMWVLCLLNCITQYICIRGVHKTTATLGTLTATLATTVRKFMSLLFSIFWFANSFTSYHWAGTVLVFLGSLFYTFAEVIARRRPSTVQSPIAAAADKPKSPIVKEKSQ